MEVQVFLLHFLLSLEVKFYFVDIKNLSFSTYKFIFLYMVYIRENWLLEKTGLFYCGLY